MSTAYDFVVQFPLWERRPSPVAPVESEISAVPLREEFVQLRAALAASLGAQISSASELARVLAKKERSALPTMIAQLDRLLRGGIQRGKLTEIAGRRSAGRFSVVLSLLASVTQCGEAAALIDLGDNLDPQLAEASGVELPRLLWVRPTKLKDAAHAAEMVIAAGFPLVVIDLGIRVRGRRVDDAVWVRLARSAEARGAAVVVSTPFHLASTAADAAVALDTARPKWKGRGKSPRLLVSIGSRMTLDKHRRYRAGETDAMEVAAAEAVR